jgi:hypothetical protein
VRASRSWQATANKSPSEAEFRPKSSAQIDIAAEVAAMHARSGYALGFRFQIVAAGTTLDAFG